MLRIEIQPRWRFHQADGSSLDPQGLALLQAVHETGKLTEAAARTGYSYRHAWNLLAKWEAFFGSPLITLARGKGARLAPLGEKLLWADQRIRARLSPQLDNLAGELEVELNRALQETRPGLRIHASHGFAVAALREWLEQDTRWQWEVQFRGGIEAVVALHRQDCEVAGLHVPAGPLGSLSMSRIQPWLRPDQRVITFVVRTQGLMLAPGNPRGIGGLADLLRSDLRFVNRESGSGTRMLLESLLLRDNLDSAAIAGFHNEEYTHAAVAAYVASGMADAGFGVEAAARQFGLTFIPMAREHYCLLCRADSLQLPAMGALLKVLQNPEFQARIARLPGYALSRPGEVLPLAQALDQWRKESLL
ncbi:substrate-binding domain-containing protein [Pseudomonas sp. 2FE]|uniref:helix-turn-helix transcriptional regulator n=1 Tax=Pseudomonas sp. 2FE TaxID=2502190 RepID=UPI0010FA5755|nr:substrate-binding domain-containing protein [Pseudomonas sp. 2FE]